MAFFGTFHVYLLRVNLSAAIVAMVDYDGLKMQYLGDPNISNGSTANPAFVSTTASSEGLQYTNGTVRRSCGKSTDLTEMNAGIGSMRYCFAMPCDNSGQTPTPRVTLL